MAPPKSNFEPLKRLHPLAYEFARAAELNFGASPDVSLIKLGQLGEILAKDVGTRRGIDITDCLDQHSVLQRLESSGTLPGDIAERFHVLRMRRNRAVHPPDSPALARYRGEAQACLRHAHAVCVWYACSVRLAGTEWQFDAAVSSRQAEAGDEVPQRSTNRPTCKEARMPYSAEISRSNPTAFLFVIDQSGSMAEAWLGERTKAQAVSDALNRLLAEIITKWCSKDEGVRHYFDVGVIGYGGHGYSDALPGAEGGLLKPIPELERAPLRVETRSLKVPDGAGGIVETTKKFPVWFDPKASGGTPMVAAMKYAAQEIATWCDGHLTAYPPTVIHITDGESTDGDAEPVAKVIREMCTNDGSALLFNLHISSTGGSKVIFPESDVSAPTPDGKRLFRMSSVLPPHMLRAARSSGYEVGEYARGYGYNADFVDLVSFFDIGTRPVNLAR